MDTGIHFHWDWEFEAKQRDTRVKSGKSGVQFMGMPGNWSWGFYNKVGSFEMSDFEVMGRVAASDWLRADFVPASYGHRYFLFIICFSPTLQVIDRASWVTRKESTR